MAMSICRAVNQLRLVAGMAVHQAKGCEWPAVGIQLAHGEAARLVSYIRQDETPHVEYLRTALSEMRERTFVGDSGRRIPGAEVIGTLWDLLLADSLGARREQLLRQTLDEVEYSLAGHPRRDDVLEEFHALGSVRPAGDGALVDTGPGY